MQIRLVAVGKLKEPWLREAFAEYEKRLQRFCKLSLIEIAEERLLESPSQAEILAALEQEGRAILSQARGTLIALCIEGKMLDSVSFAETMEKLAVSGESTVTFAIGSSFGLHDSVKSQAASCLSLSRMTFPHQLARVLLLEQLYRAFQIGAGGKYHK